MSDISFDDIPSAKPAAADINFDDIGFDDLPDAAPAAGVGDYVAEGAKGFGRGAQSFVTSPLKGIAGAQANRPSFEPGQSPLEQAARGDEQFAETFTQGPKGAPRPVKEDPLWQTAEAVEKFTEPLIGPAPGWEKSWTGDIGAGFGSMAAGILTSMVSGPTALMLFATGGMGEAAERAEKAGATPEQVAQATRLGTIAGATDVVDALLPALGSTGKALGFVQKVGVRAVAGALAEGGQEGLQQFIQNAIAKGVYKPDQDYFEDVPRSMAIGAIVGGTVAGGHAAIQGKDKPAEKVSPEELQARANETGATITVDGTTYKPAARPEMDRVMGELDALLNEAQAVDEPVKIQDAAEGEAGVPIPPIEAPAVDPMFEDLPAAAPSEVAEKIDTAASEANPEPSEAQKEAGNYKKGHINVHGLDITIENARGTARFGMTPSGEPWTVTLPDHYGYIKKTEGADGDQVDAYIGPKPESERVFIVDQKDAETGKFDEHKAMLGYETPGEALDAYETAFSDGRAPERIQGVTEMSVPEFKDWLKEGDTTKPIAQAPRAEPEGAVDLVEEKTKTGAMVPKQQLFLEVGKKRYGVADFKEASEKVVQVTEEGMRQGLGGSDFKSPLIVDQSGNVIGYVAWNGRVFEGTPEHWTADTKLLFDNREKSSEARETGPSDSGPKQIAGKAGPSGKRKAQEKAPAEKWTLVGKNVAGHKLYEDARGVRSYVDNGIRVTETVSLAPKRGGGMDVSVGPRSNEYQTAQEAAPTWAGILNAVPKGEDGRPDLDAAFGPMADITGKKKPAFKDLTPEQQIELLQRIKEPKAAGKPAKTTPEAPKDANIKGKESADADRARASVPETAPEVPEGKQPEGAARAEGRPAPVSGSGGDAGGRAVPDDHREGGDRKGPAEGLRGEGAAPAKPAADSGRDGAERHSEPAAAKQGVTDARKAIAERSKQNYRITDADELGAGGPKVKVRANIEAIRILKQIQDDAREATPEEKAKLVRYVGWGAFAQDVFATHKAEWKTDRAALRSLLTEEEYDAARASTLNAHYTSVPVVKGMWDALEHLGFKGGYAIEPSAGVGHFIGLEPDAIAKRTAWTAVELDKITGGILKALYGGSEVTIGGYETFKRPSNFYDLAISNVPFGNYNLREQPYGSYPIHDFFFVKSLDKVRPGGLVAFITSRYTLDRSDDSTRRMLAKKGDFIGAIRLPGGKAGAFASNAGAEVTTDILFLRKRIPGEPDIGFNWTATREIETPDGPVSINEYFADRPEMMLGEMRLQGTQYRANEPVLMGDNENLQERIAKAAALMPGDILAPLGARATVDPAVTAYDIDVGVKDGAFFEKDGKIYRREAGQGVEPKISGPDRDKVKRLIKMRDSVNQLLAAQASGKTEGNAAIRSKLRKEYKAFVEKHGPINKETTVETKRKDKAGDPIITTRQPNLSTFLKDPDAWKVASIENYDAETGKATPAAIFERDILAMKAERAIKGPADALAASLDAKGRVDLEEMARTLNLRSNDAVIDAMGALIYQDPDGREWVTADAYLSGDVVQKLEDARAAAEGDKAMRRNVEALEKVQPAPLTRADIVAQLGAPWVPNEVYEQFFRDELGATHAKIHRVPITGEWKAVVGYAARDAQAKYATERVGIDAIANAAMNNTQVTVYDKGPDDTSVVNDAATREARAKTAALKEAFTGNHDMGTEGWVFGDDERAMRLEAIYNRTYNNLVPRKFDGSHLTLPGLAATVTNSSGDTVDFKLRPHQKNAVWRMVQSGNTLLAHVVGAGKTYTMIAGGMEMKRLGIIRKPAYVVPNHMLEQFSREFLQAYPNAKLLVAQKDEMTRENRRSFVAKTATNDWDGIVITHDAFGRVGMGREFREKFVRDQLAELETIIRAEKADKSPTVKQLEKTKKSLQGRLEALLNEERKDQGVTFEETGIDHVFVDEAHLFKNLQFITRMGRVKGLAQGASQRAEDLFLKTRYLEDKRPGRSAVFATGTPISNTMAEMWTMMRYLELEKLRARGLDVFDSWAQTFGQVVEQMELSADGRTFKEVSSFSKFVNIPELISLYSEVADTQTADMLKLPRPEVKKESGQPGIEIVEAEPSPPEEAYINDLVKRAEMMKGKRPEKGADNMLKIVTEGRKIATDGRLIDSSYGFNPLGKINKAVNKIAEIYEEGKEPGMVQIVFLDMGTPKNRAAAKVVKLAPVEGEEVEGDDPADAAVRLNLYEDIRERLVGKGIPQKEIAFIHEATDDMKKARLFERVRSGDVRVMIGSTGKMGVGTNVQDRLIAMHHIDAPWKPAEVEQRDGRIVRQGNMNPNVRLYRYVTKRSFDAFMWQKLDTKSKFIGQVLSGARGVRSAEDIDNPLPEAAEMKAAATGDPRILEHAELERKVRQLSVQKKAFTSSYSRAQWEQQTATERLEQLRGKVDQAKEDASKVVDTSGENFAMTLDAPYGKGKVKERNEAGADIINALTKLTPMQFYTARMVDIGKISGLTAQLELAGRYADGEPRLFATPYLKGKGLYTRGPEASFLVTPEADPGGLVRKYENLLRQVASQPESIEYQIGREEENLKRLSDTLKQKTWPRDKELKDAQEKLAEITKALKAKGEKTEEKEGENLKSEAQAEGFDTSVDYWHGTTYGRFTTFKESTQKNDVLGPANYLSKHKTGANFYGPGRGGDLLGPFWVRGNIVKPDTMVPWQIAADGTVKKTAPAINVMGMLKGQLVTGRRESWGTDLTPAQYAREFWKRRGVDGYDSGLGLEVAIYDPANIRAGFVPDSRAGEQQLASVGPRRVLTPVAGFQRPQIERMLNTLIRRVAGPDVKVQFQDAIPIPESATKGWGSVTQGIYTAGGIYMPASHVIKLALADPHYRNPGSFALHESFHAVESRLLKDKELKVLERAEPQLRAIAKEFASLTDEQAEGLAPYEVRAIAFEAYSQARMDKKPVKDFPGAARMIFERLRILFERIRNALNGMGFKSAEDVFTDVFEGKMASRPPVYRKFEGLAASIAGSKVDPVDMSRFLRGEISAEDMAPGKPNWGKVEAYLNKNFTPDERAHMGEVFDDALAGGETLEKAPDRERAVVEKLLEQAGGKPPAPPSRPPATTGGGGGGAQRRILDRIVPSDKNRKRLPTLNQVYTATKDDLNPLRVLRNELTGGKDVPIEGDPYRLARLARGAFGKAEQMLETGTFSFHGLADTGKGLKPILDPVKNDLDGFRAYMAARRALELSNRGIKTGIAVSDAAIVAREGHKKYGKPFEELVNYQRRVLDYLRDAGVVSPQAYAAMVEANKDYVPFFRLMETEADGKDAAGRNLKVRDPIKGIKGSTREIIDPIESIIKNTYLYISLAEKNRALTALDDLAQSSPRGAEFLRKPKRGVHPIRVAEEEVARFLEDHGLDKGAAEAFTIFRPNAFRPEPDQISFFRDGKREVREVDPEVAEAVNAMDRESFGLLMRILATPARLLRLGATQAPEFIVRNPIRDQFSATVLSEHGYIPVYDFVRGLGSLLRNDKMYQDWLKSGGSNATLVSMDRKYIESEVMKLSNPTVMGKLKNVVKSPIDFLRMLSELAENATRVGEFKRAVGKGKTPMEAAFSSREVTLDFARIGAQMRGVNALIPFFNASIEGTDREIRAFGKRPLATSLKVAAFITLPSVLLWFANHDDERYEEIPQWQKDLFWLVFTKDNVWRIPKPFALGVLFGSVPERSLEAFFGKNPNAFKHVGKSVKDALLPNMIPAFMAPTVEQFANRSTFTERPIVPKYLEDVLPEYQYTPYTSDTAKLLGKAIARIPGMDKSSFASPMVLDNYVRAWTGGLGQYAVSSADKALRATGVAPKKVDPTLTAADMPVLKAFAVRHPSSSAQSIQDFYDTYDERKKALGTVKYLTKLGDKESASSASEGRNLETAERIHKALGQQMKFARDVWFNKDITPEEKRSLIDRTYLRAIEIAKLGNKIFRETEAAKKASKQSARSLEAAQ